jgi:AbrB family looped-hinge helix DNA binding protein
MKAKSIRRLDGQGRVILPAHIRKALNLAQDSAVTIDMTEDGEIRIRPEKERCCICGREAREDALQLDSGKLVCHRCVEIIKEGTKEW